MSKQQAAALGPGTAGAADALIAPLRDNALLIDAIAEISGRPRKEVVQRFIREHADLGANVRDALAAAGVPPHIWTRQLEEFYAETDAFLYETLVWNRSPLKVDMRHWVGDYLSRLPGGPLRILTYGDGLGIDSYYLAQRGHRVTYFDVSRECAQFARRIFDYGGLDVEMLDDPHAAPQDYFDAAVCLDVLEHVPDPSEVVGWLSRALRPGGKLLVHAPFHYVTPAVATHLKSNRRYSGDRRTLYRRHGLHAVDGRLFWNPIVFERTSAETPRTRSSLPLAVRLGGWLLGVGRHWSTIHVLIGKALTDGDALRSMAPTIEGQADRTSAAHSDASRTAAPPS